MIGPILQAVKLAVVAAFVALLTHLWASAADALLVGVGVYWFLLSIFLK